jgi:hypothetical protein
MNFKFIEAIVQKEFSRYIHELHNKSLQKLNFLNFFSLEGQKNVNIEQLREKKKQKLG